MVLFEVFVTKGGFGNEHELRELYQSQTTILEDRTKICVCVFAVLFKGVSI